ncbi:dihydroorotase [Steroidobacter denitrificans]|uniref:Dihydroorotase n=1 Tax=Steroidobacter denitrificans TaxID=465721 RepID=A0A127FB73_STEDE|nr:dihydroorotase [Steroidobacter denitrificans]AMN47657.1 dihydroorotase [Steroidobacter denitrificans]
MTTLRILRPDDWHLHVRDGAHLTSIVPFTAKRFARAVIMPNLKPPVTHVDMARAYRERILAAVPANLTFEPLMTLYLTNTTSAADLRAARDSGFVIGAKLYPAGATTHSDAGVSAIERIYPALEAMQEYDLVLQVHGEATDAAVDVFDREKVFIERVLAPLAERFPALRIVFEHITTREAVQFVHSARTGVAATLTPQHLLLNRNALFQGGIRPHHYCLPVLKREADRRALIDAATSEDARFFLGTDSAPHARHTKENACGCAGVFSAHAAIELYAEAFEEAGCLERLQAFAAERGADFYGLPRNTSFITLERATWMPPPAYRFDQDELVPFRAGESIRWRLVEES